MGAWTLLFFTAIASYVAWPNGCSSHPIHLFLKLPDTGCGGRCLCRLVSDSENDNQVMLIVVLSSTLACFLFRTTFWPPLGPGRVIDGASLDYWVNPPSESGLWQGITTVYRWSDWLTFAGAESLWPLWQIMSCYQLSRRSVPAPTSRMRSVSCSENSRVIRERGDAAG